MLKVAFNTLPLKNQHGTRGIGSYTFNLLSGLKKRPDIELIEFAEISQVKNADLIHIPFFDLFSFTLPIYKQFPTVITVHDVTPLVFPMHYPKGLKGLLNLNLQKFALRGCAAVITDSLSSKKDIKNFLNINLDKIYPIYLAPASDFKVVTDTDLIEYIKNKYKLPVSYALYTGSVNWNKNLLNIAKACKNAGIRLLIAGSGFEKRNNLDHPELKSFKEFLDLYQDDPDVTILGFVALKDLVVIENLAKVVLLPSFYEGFGLPILEAQACGTPVITSKLSSMPEVAGEGAILVDPHSVEEITNAIIRVTDKAERVKLTKAGLENVKKFSWEKTVDQTVSVYKQVIKI